MVKTCPACSDEITDTEATFCSECGYNLQINTQRIETGQISGTYLEQYQQLVSSLSRFEGVYEQLDQQSAYLNNLRNQRNNAKKYFDKQTWITNKEYKDIEKLKKFTWTSFKARVKGDREEQLEKEEGEYFDALNKKEGAIQDLQKLDNMTQLAEQQYNQIKSQFDKKVDLQKQLNNLIHEACEGVSDPVEDQIEVDVQRLIAQRSPITIEKNKFNIARDQLNSAQQHFQRAISLLDGAHSLSTYDTFFGGGYFADSAKHSKMADSRNMLQAGYRSLERAYYELPQLPRIPQVHVEQGSFFWDVAFDNFFSDMRSRNRIQKALRDVRSVQHAMIQPINWVAQQLQGLHQQDVNLYNQIMEKQAQLTRERERMIKEAIKGKKMKS
jgi:hypothetical protein